MDILKFSSSHLFDGDSLLCGGYVLITDGCGTVEEVVETENAGDDIQWLEGIIAPGFINTHCHLELSHLNGLIPEHTGLVDFVFAVVSQRHLPEVAVAAAITAAEDEMLANGIVAVGDICNNTSTLLQKQKGRLAYYNFIETSGWPPEVAPVRFKRSKDIYEAFLSAIPNSKQSVVPHAPYSVSSELWKMMVPFFNGHSVTIHNQEAPFEDDLFKTGTGDFLRMYQKMNLHSSSFLPSGKTGLQTYLHYLQQAGEIILVHNTFTTEEDILFAKKMLNSLNWCLCPNANLYIENALPPIALLRKHGCTITLGTDSLASNHSLSILDEMKTITKNFPEIPITEILKWATINGAKALGVENKYGSFGKGKTPGVILIEGLENGLLQQQTKVKRLI